MAFTAYPQALGKGSYRIFLLGGDQTLNSGPAASFQAYVPYTLGDVDNNGKIQAVDALAVLRHVAKIETLDDTASLAADVDCDGKVKAVDALAILRYVAKIIDHF